MALPFANLGGIKRHPDATFSQPETPAKVQRPESRFSCQHGAPAVMRTVAKDGPNKGRNFWVCDQDRSSQCKFFQWDDEAPRDTTSGFGGSGTGGGGGSVDVVAANAPKCTHQLRCVLRTVNKEGRNKGKQFYVCGKPRAAQCDFFMWKDAADKAAVSGAGGGPTALVVSAPAPAGAAVVRGVLQKDPHMGAWSAKTLVHENPWGAPVGELYPSRGLRASGGAAEHKPTWTPFLPKSVEEWQRHMLCTPEDAERIRNYEQRSPEWIEQRRNYYRLTASRFGTAVGHDKYTTPEQLVKEMVWGSKFEGNKATRWGSFCECTARDCYVAMRKQQLALSFYGDLRSGDEARAPEKPPHFEVEETGLNVIPGRPGFGYSPDGVVHTEDVDRNPVTGIVEFKCPWGAKLYSTMDKYQVQPHPMIPKGIPAQYYDQIQGIMGLGKYPWADFVVWTPDGMEIKRYDFNQKYWEEFLWPKMEHWYFNMFLPALIARGNGLLEPGEIHPSLDVNL